MTNKWATFVLVWFAMLMQACVESKMPLLRESPLPRWLSLPPSYSRPDVNVDVTFYTLTGPRIVATTTAPPHTVLFDKRAVGRWHPQYWIDRERLQTAHFYPQYYILNIDGLDETFEIGCVGAKVASSVSPGHASEAQCQK